MLIIKLVLKEKGGEVMTKLIYCTVHVHGIEILYEVLTNYTISSLGGFENNAERNGIGFKMRKLKNL